MRQGLLLGCLVVGMLVGCESTPKTAEGESRPDIETLQDAPEPNIHFGTYIAAGDLAASRGQFARATDQYEKALKLKPNDAGVMKKLALGHAKSGQMGLAIDAWKRYLVASNDSADGYGSLGYAYELAGNPTEAEKTYKAGIEKHPKGALVRVNYGLMLVRGNKVDEGIIQLGTVLQPHEVNYNIGSVYEQLGRRDLAQFYYRRSIECNPNFSPARQKLASLE